MKGARQGLPLARAARRASNLSAVLQKNLDDIASIVPRRHMNSGIATKENPRNATSGKSWKNSFTGCQKWKRPPARHALLIVAMMNRCRIDEQEDDRFLVTCKTTNVTSISTFVSPRLPFSAASMSGVAPR